GSVTSESKTNAIVSAFLLDLNHTRKTELAEKPTYELDMSQWVITTDEDKRAHKPNPTKPINSVGVTTRCSQPAIHPAQMEKTPEAELPAIDFCMSTYQKMHNSAKPLDRVFKECSFNEFFTVMVNNPDFFNSFHTELNRMSTKAQFVQTLARIRSNQLPISTPQKIQLSVYHSQIDQLKPMDRAYLPGTATATINNATHAVRKVDFVDEPTSDTRVVRKKIVRLDSYKQYVDPSLKTLFVLDLDDTMICKTILEKHRHGTTITAANFESMCAQIPLHSALEQFLAELKNFNGSSRVVLVTNTKGRYLGRKLDDVGLKREYFHEISSLDDAEEGHVEGSKEVRVLKDCKKSGFSPEQIVTFDDEDTHLRKIETMALSTLKSVTRCVSLHVKTAIPSRHALAAVASFVFDGGGDTYSNFEHTFYHNSYLDSNGQYILDDNRQKIRDMRFLEEKQEFDRLSR
ncbi:MAG: hypothetical protein HAW66_03780, partial [Shewanella sp.]|nr:hypothetical protein [Shewanella sp.]